MRKETSYVLALEKEVQLRIKFVRERNQITFFIVQLEYYINNHWYPVVRYDTAHDFAHCDILMPDGSQEKKTMPVSNFNEALTYAQQDIMANYQRYCKRFEEWHNG